MTGTPDERPRPNAPERPRALHQRRWTATALLPFWGWMIAMLVHGSLRWDHVAIAVFAAVLALGPFKWRRLFLGVFPLGLVGLSYDAMRFVQHVGVSESTVHVCDLRAAEARWFGIVVDGERMTLHDWLQRHATTFLDVLCAIPYGAFLAIVFGYCVYLLARHFEAEQRFAWGFFALNIAGFITYHVYPAAPPWYFHQYGCRVDLDAAASAGPNLMRVDQLLGIPYFAGLYGRASDVFGAVPSLHVAYPTLMLAVGWRLHGPLGRTVLALFLAWMCFAAVYLDHHWVIDVVAGITYALVVAFAVRWVASALSPNRGAAYPSSLRAETSRASG